MTTSFADGLRAALRDLADETRPVEFLPRLDGAPVAVRDRRRLVLVAVAAAVAVLVGIGYVILLRAHQSAVIEPVRPPEVFRLSEAVVPAPGRAQIAVITAQQSPGVGTVHVHPADGGPDVTLSPTDWVPSVYSQTLSQDGTRLVRQYDFAADPRLEVVNLVTGSTNRLGGHRGFCPRLSPDNSTVAIIARWTGRLVFLDASTGQRRLGGHGAVGDGSECPVISWSPDGSRLTVGNLAETLVLDARGRTMRRLPGRSAVNSTMSWSPDGRSILLHDRPSGRFVVHELRHGAESPLAAPRDALRPLGWWGDRVVWLVGPAGGTQRLVSTDRAGHDPRPWLRLDIGQRPVESVQWSRELAGGSS